MPRTILYIFVGYPGAGKTTIAKYIASQTGAVHLWADEKRHKLFKQVSYSEAESKKLYDQLNNLCASYLKNGRSVIYDTNFNFYDDRQHLRTIAEKHGAELKLIWVTTPAELARKRAVTESTNSHTRIWGNMAKADFDRISGRLESPRPSEAAIKIDGTAIGGSDISSLLEDGS